MVASVLDRMCPDQRDAGAAAPICPLLINFLLDASFEANELLLLHHLSADLSASPPAASVSESVDAFSRCCFITRSDKQRWRASTRRSRARSGHRRLLPAEDSGTLPKPSKVSSDLKYY